MDLENLLREKSELSSILEKGMTFEVGKKKFLIKEPFLGTLDILSGLFIDMDFDDNEMQENPLKESKKLARKTLRLCAKVVAVAVLNKKWKIRILSPILARYFFWKATPSLMMNLAIIINTMCNFGDFTNSIRLMSGARTTKPNPIEQNKEA